MLQARNKEIEKEALRHQSTSNLFLNKLRQRNDEMKELEEEMAMTKKKTEEVLQAYQNLYGEHNKLIEQYSSFREFKQLMLEE